MPLAFMRMRDTIVQSAVPAQHCPSGSGGPCALMWVGVDAMAECSDVCSVKLGRELYPEARGNDRVVRILHHATVLGSTTLRQLASGCPVTRTAAFGQVTRSASLIFHVRTRLGSCALLYIAASRRAWTTSGLDNVRCDNVPSASSRSGHMEDVASRREGVHSSRQRPESNAVDRLQVSGKLECFPEPPVHGSMCCNSLHWIPCTRRGGAKSKSPRLH